MSEFEEPYQKRLRVHRKKIEKIVQQEIARLKHKTTKQCRAVTDENLQTVEKQAKDRLIEKEILPEVFEDVRLELELEREKAIDVSIEREKFQKIQNLIND